ncbi:MAG: thermonuclease family protein [Rhodobacteraceae bacterium]|nr:thermonuclease family protein [Paracoccaceae bacterium]
MTRIIFFLVAVTSVVLMVSSASTIEICGQGKRYTCVVDGDTIWLKGEKIRLMGFDTPETTTAICGGDREKQLGYKATERLQELLTNHKFTVHRDGKDRYGRTLAIIRIDEVNVGDILVDEGLARYWPDGDEFWCN